MYNREQAHRVYMETDFFVNKGNQFSLSEAAAYDKKTNAKERLTGWGIICKERTKKN